MARLITDFFAAYNQGERNAASFIEFAGVPGDGGWYSVSQNFDRDRSRHFVARDDSTLRQYFARRYRQHEEWALRELRVVDYSSGLAHIESRLRLRADDLPHRGIGMHGKGAVDCKNRKLGVWSVGDEESVPARERTPLCPNANQTAGVVVACSRRSS
jgi:hypothetical protein